MTQLVPQNEYVIMFHDKGKKWISKDQALALSKLMDDPANKYVNLGDGKRAISGINSILSKQEHGEQYPTKDGNAPVYTDYFSKYEEYEKFDWQKVTSKGAISEMIRGLERYFSDRPKAMESSSLLVKMKEKLNGLNA